MGFARETASTSQEVIVATFTMRLPDKDYEALQAVALLTGRTMAEVARDAIVKDLDAFASSEKVKQELAEATRKRELAMATLVARETTAD